MKSVIYDKLKEIKDSKIISFHMPGHKYGRIYSDLGYDEKIKSLIYLDTTEIIETDNLHNANGIIKKSQDMTKRTLFPDISTESMDLFYLVNGSTCGIEAAIMSCCKMKEKIILNRACHMSAFNSCMVSSLKPVFVKEIIDSEEDIFLGVSPEEYIKTIEENKDAKAVFITRPTYYGMCRDIESVIKKAHEYGMAVIVDEAHGAHFNLNSQLPDSALYYGADIVIQSIHKTLPALTQTSIMLVQNNIVDRDRLSKSLRVFETSSPSYVFLSNIEIAVDIYEKHGKMLMEELLNNIYRFRRSLKRYRIYDTSDMTKIFINTIDHGINGYDFEKILRYNYNIQVELSNYNGILMLCTIANNKSDFDTMIKAMDDILERKLFTTCFFEKKDNIDGISSNIYSVANSRKIKVVFFESIPEMAVTPREAFDSDKENVSIEKSIGRVCTEFIIPYPPGVCILAPGEIITEDIVKYLIYARSMNIDINGMESNEFEYIKVIKEKRF